jgi:hypothetical protein
MKNAKMKTTRQPFAVWLAPLTCARWKGKSSFRKGVNQRRFILVFLMLVAMTKATAQQGENSSVSSADNNDREQSTNEGLQKRDNEFGFWGGISFATATLIGRTRDAKFGNVGLRYGRVLLVNKTVAFEWTIDAVPLALLSNRQSVTVRDERGVLISLKERKSVYGWGAAPIGLKFNFRPSHRVQPFGQGTGGFLCFNEAVPQPDAARCNFTLDFAGGVQVVNTGRRAFAIGYKFQHISNGNRAPNNPGVDVHMIYGGFSVFR